MIGIKKRFNNRKTKKWTFYMKKRINSVGHGEKMKSQRLYLYVEHNIISKIDVLHEEANKCGRSWRKNEVVNGWSYIRNCLC